MTGQALYNKLVSPYLNYKYVWSLGYRHNFLVGDRGVGKTYGLTEEILDRCYKHNKKFVWVRNTEAVLKEMTKFNGRGFLADHPQRLRMDPALFETSQGNLYYGDQLLGTFVSLSKFFSVKGVNYDDYEYFIFDEFMPEVREAIRVDYDYALQSIMQSIFRTRTNFKAFYLANVLKTSSNILDFFSFNITPHFEGQVMQRNKKLSAVIIYLQGEDRESKHREVGVGDAFAMANKYNTTAVIVDYEKNIDKSCGSGLKRKEIITIVVGERNYFLLREYKDKVAIIPIKHPPESYKEAVYTLNRKVVFGEAIYDHKLRNKLIEFWENNMYIFRSEYALRQFASGLFTS